MRVVFAPLAADDVREAYDFISADSVSTADRWLLGLIGSLGRLGAGLVIGRAVRLKDGSAVHSWPLPPYRIYYRVRSAELQVVRVYHQARRPIERRPRRR